MVFYPQAPRNGLRSFGSKFSLWPSAILFLSVCFWYLGVARRLLPWQPQHAYQRATLSASRGLQELACQRDLDSLHAYTAEMHASVCGLDNLPPAQRPPGYSKLLGPPLHIFLRVSTQERSWSGAGRFLGWTKAQTVLTTAYSLRVALDMLDSALAPPRSINLTVLYDGPQEDKARQKTWASAMGAIFQHGKRAKSPAAIPLTLNHIPVAPADSGNRGTNLLQFRFAKESCLAGGPGGASSSGGGGGGSSGGGTPTPDEPLVYFVEDDYVHAPSALAEFVDLLTLVALDGSAPPEFATLTDYPDRLTFGVSDLGFGSASILGSMRRHWRTLPSTTMSFGARCSNLVRALPTMEAIAPHDQDMWHSLLWWRFLGLPLWQRGERLVGPMPSLAIHATDAFYSFYGPPLDKWGAKSRGGGEVAVTSWCGLATCLKEGAVEVLAAAAPASLALLTEESKGQ